MEFLGWTASSFILTKHCQSLFQAMCSSATLVYFQTRFLCKLKFKNEKLEVVTCVPSTVLSTCLCSIYESREGLLMLPMICLCWSWKLKWFTVSVSSSLQRNAVLQFHHWSSLPTAACCLWIRLDSVRIHTLVAMLDISPGNNKVTLWCKGCTKYVLCCFVQIIQLRFFFSPQIRWLIQIWHCQPCPSQLLACYLVYKCSENDLKIPRICQREAFSFSFVAQAA